MGEFYTLVETQIQEMVNLVKTNLDISQRETIKCLIVLDVHNRDTVEKIKDLGIDSHNDFEWAK